MIRVQVDEAGGKDAARNIAGGTGQVFADRLNPATLRRVDDASTLQRYGMVP